MLIKHDKELPISLEHSCFSNISEIEQKKIEDIITWRIKHQSNLYPNPGRTILLNNKIKIKGAGFYNPPNVSFSGLKRTIYPVPENIAPMKPLEQAFQRDIIHVDPSNSYPHLMQSVHSNFAPVGGMTLETAENDQIMFRNLTFAGLPSNMPLAVYRYQNLFLNGKPMGVSVSLLPKGIIPITPYDIYIGWNRGVDNNSLNFLREFLHGYFSLDDPECRLRVVQKLGKIAGDLLLKFSLRAGLFRFSGSPDNWTMKSHTKEPLYFSDVDTSRMLVSISKEQYYWEIIRNLLSMIHQWFYFFIPSLSYVESKYSKKMLNHFDFIESILLGFFQDKPAALIKKSALNIWKFLDPVINSVNQNNRIPLRGGEYFLQRFYNRPTFYFVVMDILKELLHNSSLELYCAKKCQSGIPQNIDKYILNSSNDPSHVQFFEDYTSKNVLDLIK